MLDVIPKGPAPGGLPRGGEESLLSDARYRRLLLAAVVSVSMVALAPLLIMTWVNYRQYEQACRFQISSHDTCLRSSITSNQR